MRHTQILLAVLVVAATVLPAGAVAVEAPGAERTDARALQSTCDFPVTETDATGTAVTIESDPDRIVTLAPSAAQTMWEIGAKDEVVGVTKHAMYLEGAAQKHNVTGNGGEISVEEVVGLNPDLVLAPNVVGNETVEKLRETGLTVYWFSEAKDLQAIKDKTRLIGQFVGACEGADRAVAQMEETLSRVDRAVEGEPRPRAIYVFYGYTAGNETFIHSLIRAAGATNVAAEAGIQRWGKVSQEIIVEHNPQWIILNSDDDAVPKTEAFNSTTAVEKDQIVVVDRNLLNQPAPRIVQVVVKLAKAFHPEAYAAAAETPTATPTRTATQTPTATPTPAPTGTEKRSPGFGVATAVLALLGAALFARR